jgi:hypothetical protein
MAISGFSNIHEKHDGRSFSFSVCVDTSIRELGVQQLKE